MSDPIRNVAILIYDDVEVLDFAGPFEVFAITAELNDFKHSSVSLVAENDRPVKAVNGMRVLPDFTFDTCPAPDILVIATRA